MYQRYSVSKFYTFDTSYSHFKNFWIIIEPCELTNSVECISGY